MTEVIHGFDVVKVEGNVHHPATDRIAAEVPLEVRLDGEPFSVIMRPGTHLCMVRLELMRLNTAPALDPSALTDVSRLASHTSAQLRALGRLPEPMLREAGSAGFKVVTWDQALDRLAFALGQVDPKRFALYLTSRGITNEVYYAAQKAARFFGTSHVDNSARLCHAASTAAMKATPGYGASTCSYTDWLHADLIVLFGSNVANNQPVTIKYLHYAKQNGAQIAVVNPYREPGLERYWIPSIPRSAWGGTALADHWFEVDTGGDLPFLMGVLRALVERGGVDEAFVRDRTVGFEEGRDRALATDWSHIERSSGSTRERIEAFAQLLIDRPNAVCIWSMGLTQHVHGVDTIKALVNVGLARGLPAGAHRGLVPIRGHSGVQGGAEVGCAPRVDPATAKRWEQLWGFRVSQEPGWIRAIRIGSAKDGAVTAIIPVTDAQNPAYPGGTGAEDVAGDAQENVYGAEVNWRTMKKYVRTTGASAR